MKLKELTDMWKRDSVIDVEHLVVSASEVPKLHAKYLAYLTTFRKQLRVEEVKYMHLRRDKKRWFMGKMSEEKLKELGWDQWLEDDMTSAAAERAILDDPDLLKLQTKCEYIKNMISTLEYIMKSISTRGWDVKNAISMFKYERGLE